MRSCGRCGSRVGAKRRLCHTSGFTRRPLARCRSHTPAETQEQPRLAHSSCTEEKPPWRLTATDFHNAEQPIIALSSVLDDPMIR